MPYEIVCTYRCNTVSTLSYPKYIIDACNYFNKAYILAETNDAGQQVLDIILQDLEYEGVISTMQKKKVTQLSAGFSGNRAFFGVRTTKQVKRIGCASLKAIVESDKLLINDYQVLNEFFRFSLHGTSYEAEEGNDDLVMCCVLFAWLTTQPYFRELTNVDIRRNIYEETEKMIEEDLVPFGLLVDGNEEDFSQKLYTDKEFIEWFRQES